MSTVTTKTTNRTKSTQENGLQSAIDLAWAYIEFDADGTILKANDNFLKALGYARLDEIKGKHHRIFCEEHYAQSAEYQQFWVDLAAGKVNAGEFRRIRKDGSEVWINASYAPIKDTTGKVKKVVKLASEITDMVKDRIFSRGIQHAVDTGMAMIEFDTEGNILNANENFLRTVGYSLAEIQGQHHKIFCPENVVTSEEYARFWPELASGQLKVGEFLRKDKSGQDIWLQASYTPVRDDSGSVQKIIKLASDITKEKYESNKLLENVRAQEEELRQNLEEIQATQEEVERGSQRIKRTLDQAIDAIISINSRKEITFFNPAAVKMFGYREEEVLGQNVKMIVPLKHRGNHDDYVENNVSTGENKVVGIGRDMEMERKDGSKFWGNLALSRVEVGGEVEFTAFIKDITQERANILKARSIEAAVNAGWASIEFEPDGTILTANDNFLKGLGYHDLREIQGQHHRIFCTPEYANSPEYAAFWPSLASGQQNSGEFLRLKKDGSEIWINASYTPVRDDEGKVFKVIKIATEVTEMVNSRTQASAVKSAVDTGWASIEFKPDGTIISANDNFVATLGYHSVEEIVGKHHRIFCDKHYVNSEEYRNMWRDLADGQVKAGEFERFTKSGEQIWINASYTPVKDANGKVFKVIKIANDITDQKTVITAIQEVVKVAGEQGDLSARVQVPTAQGDYKVLADSMNQLMDNIVRPFNEIRDLVVAMSNGDLSKSFALAVDGDFKEMGIAFNEALINLNTLIQQINESANLVVTSSKEMSGKGEQMKGSTQEMASAIQQMAEGVQDQAQQIDQASSLIEKILTNAKDTALKADVINKSAEEGQRNSKEGVSTIEAVVENMKEIQSSASVTSESIKVLDKRSEEIARTLNVITDIASQTNLLALNAAIEAARAGEAGRGFAVVAEEIRKLAEDSRKSAQDIEKVISEVQNDINQASKSIEGMEVSVKNGNKAGGEAEAVFRKIDQASVETLSLSKQILESAAVQEEAINGTVKNIEKVVVVSEETASGTEQIASSSQELNQGMDEVSATSSDLADVAYQLLEGVSKFKLRQS
ncbi:PAS domain S-box protein [Persicobacter diffluens]|uniref:Chemotaxis protein n=1 Tax=Persicobacter diffluens TaxID=981 RepID=A0AAN4W3W8_9BACT|nr:hypothetical protein PEDI_43790 [Persicobacter diffluens]